MFETYTEQLEKEVDGLIEELDKVKTDVLALELTLKMRDETIQKLQNEIDKLTIQILKLENDDRSKWRADI